jgi:hypothetical protein
MIMAGDTHRRSEALDKLSAAQYLENTCCLCLGKAWSAKHGAAVTRDLETT